MTMLAVQCAHQQTVYSVEWAHRGLDVTKGHKGGGKTCNAGGFTQGAAMPQHLCSVLY